MFRSKHSGWTWEGKRTPFGGGGKGGGIGPAGGQVAPNLNTPPNPPQAPARDVVQETMQQRQQAAAQAAQPTQVTPMPQQPAPVAPLIQQQMQQQMPPQIRGIGQQQPGLQSMLARILGYGGGSGYMPQQMMRQGMPQQGYGQPMGMPNYGRFGGGQNPLAYRPDMQAAMNNTNNVAVGVAEQQRRALQAQLDAANAQIAQNPFSRFGFGGGGGE